MIPSSKTAYQEESCSRHPLNLIRAVNSVKENYPIGHGVVRFTLPCVCPQMEGPIAVSLAKPYATTIKTSSSFCTFGKCNEQCYLNGNFIGIHGNGAFLVGHACRLPCRWPDRIRKALLPNHPTQFKLMRAPWFPSSSFSAPRMLSPARHT